MDFSEVEYHFRPLGKYGSNLEAWFRLGSFMEVRGDPSRELSPWD